MYLLRERGWFLAPGATGGRAGARCCPDPPFVETLRRSVSTKGIGPWQPEALAETGRKTPPNWKGGSGPGAEGRRPVL